MRHLAKLFISVLALATTTITASAQYYQLANQATDMLSAALQGGINYRGFVDLTYLNGVGNKSASFMEISTTQGFKKGNLFYLGVGAGVDYMFTNVNDGAYRPEGKRFTKNAVMIPMFTDFRFNFGSPQSTNFFVDLKIGAGFYVSDKFIQVGDGYINSSESFLLRPTIGARVPLGTNPKQAINFGATYQLLTNSYWYNPYGSNSVTLNSIGLNISFEW